MTEIETAVAALSYSLRHCGLSVWECPTCLPLLERVEKLVGIVVPPDPKVLKRGSRR